MPGALLGARPRPALRSVWPALYAAAGVAAWLVWRRGGLGPLTAYAGMLAASWLACPPLFGGGRPLPRACLDAAGALPSACHFAFKNSLNGVWKLERSSPGLAVAVRRAAAAARLPGRRWCGPLCLKPYPKISSVHTNVEL